MIYIFSVIGMVFCAITGIASLCWIINAVCEYVIDTNRIAVAVLKVMLNKIDKQETK